MSCGSVNFNEKLIELVREAPSLYDKGCSHYKDKQKKENAWKLFADILDVSGKHIFFCISWYGDLIFGQKKLQLTCLIMQMYVDVMSNFLCLTAHK